MIKSVGICTDLSQRSQKMQQVTKNLAIGFVGEMLRPVFENTVQGVHNKIYQSMLVDEYAKLIAPKTGIAESLACSIHNMKDD